MWASYRFTCHNLAITGSLAFIQGKRALGRVHHLMDSEVARRIRKE